jgi:hypothetical protein
LSNRSFAFQAAYFSNPAPMALIAGKMTAEKGTDQFRHQRRPDDARTQAQNIHIIMFDTLVSGINIMANTGINPVDLIRRDAGSHPRTTYQDSAIGSPTHDFAPKLFSKIRIVNGLGTVSAKIYRFVSGLLDSANHLILKWKTSMVTRNCYTHSISFHFI